MRRLASTLLIALVTLVVGTAVASPAGAARDTAKPKPPQYCRTVQAWFGFVQAAHKPADLSKGDGPALLRKFEKKAPDTVAAPAKRLAHAFARMRDHGEKKLSARANRKLDKAMNKLQHWYEGHCPAPAASTDETPSTDRQAQSSLRWALTNAKGIFTDTDSYAAATVETLSTAEPSLQFTTGPSDAASPKSVSVHVIDDTRIVMAAGTGTTCYWIRDIADGYGTEFATAPGTTCDASTPPPFVDRWP